MHQYEPLSGAFFNREFPTSWRQIDFDVDMSAISEEEIMDSHDVKDEDGNEGDNDGQLDGQNWEQEDYDMKGKISDSENIEDEDSDGDEQEEKNEEENSFEESIQ
jgi:hypothetical protein